MARQIKLDQIDDLMEEAVQKLQGRIINNVEYAEPVIYGTELPPSWKGRYRTRKQTIKGFPELQAKQLTVSYIPKELKRIIRGM